jgi:hypothetical protein
MEDGLKICWVARGKLVKIRGLKKRMITPFNDKLETPVEMSRARPHPCPLPQERENVGSHREHLSGADASSRS